MISGVPRSILYICAERPISGNPGLKFCSVFVFTFLMYGLELHFELLLLYLRRPAKTGNGMRKYR